jgi:hypothetical protein
MSVRITRRRAAIAATAAATLGLAAPIIENGSEASAATQSQHFVLYSGNHNGKDLVDVLRASGPIHGVGTAHANDAATGPVPLYVSLPAGTLLIKAKDNFQWKPNLSACTATVRSTGTYRLVKGTGAYRGMTGNGTFVETGAGVGVRAADGSCEQKFKINYVIARMTGNVQKG